MPKNISVEGIDRSLALFTVVISVAAVMLLTTIFFLFKAARIKRVLRIKAGSFVIASVGVAALARAPSSLLQQLGEQSPPPQLERSVDGPVLRFRWLRALFPRWLREG